jgi:hypothetical protein
MHFFHGECIRDEIERTGLCPECRAKSSTQGLRKIALSLEQAHDNLKDQLQKCTLDRDQALSRLEAMGTDL